MLFQVRYSKLAFRLLVKLYDCDLTFTPMILADSFYNSEQAPTFLNISMLSHFKIDSQARLGEFTTHSTDSPTIVQFAANQVLHPSISLC